MPWEDRIIQLRGLSITIIYRRRQISSRHDEYMADVIFSPTEICVLPGAALGKEDIANSLPSAPWPPSTVPSYCLSLSTLLRIRMRVHSSFLGSVGQNYPSYYYPPG